MKKLVWSETQVAGGKRFRGVLPSPPSTTGSFQDFPQQEAENLVSGTAALPTLYRDIAVLAYRVPAGGALPTPRVAMGDGKAIDGSLLADGKLTTAVGIARGTARQPATVLLDYDRPQTVRSASLYVADAAATPLSPGLRPRLEASADGTGWHKVADLVTTTAPTTVRFTPVTAPHFRVVFASAPSVGGAGGVALPAGVDLSAIAGVMGKGSPEFRVAELRLSGEARVNQFEAKAGFATTPDYYALDADADRDAAGVPLDGIVDLTARIGPGGRIDWTPTKGTWRIVRLGWSLIGKVNHPATPEATGLEVDKMDPAAVRPYLEHYIGMYRDAAGTDLIGTQGVRAIVNDSTEVGPFNWTPGMIGDFKRLRGYDPVPWLPALTGALIGSRQQSDAFLYDFRRTIADLHAAAHYGTIAQVAHENGLKTYGEAIETGRSTLGDDMSMRSHADVPMAAMWYIPRGYPPRTGFLADMKGASSVARLYGQNIAAAESMTSILSPWATGPSELRQTIDLEFAYGINRPVIHTSVHQPTDDKVPGLSLGVLGQYFNRHETWAEMARPRIDYIARNAYLLQQGRNVADVGYFYGEEAPLASLYNTHDVADALLDMLSVQGGDLVAHSGARYRLLYLGGTSRRMTLPVLRRIAALARDGATIVGSAPEGSPGLMSDPAEFVALVRTLWSGGPVTHVGKGRVLPGDVEAALRTIGAAPDLTFTSETAGSTVMFVHRKLDDGDAYFLDNRMDRTEAIEAHFRVTDKMPELWHADTGAIEPVSYRRADGETIVPLDLAPGESLFVVFRKPATGAGATIARPVFSRVMTLDGAWDVAFQPGRGAPLLLDFGTAADVAEVRINDVLVGTLWQAPYAIDIARAVRAGSNRIEVRVANLWVNRLIGDMQPGARRVAYTSIPTYKPNAPLGPAGLIDRPGRARGSGIMRSNPAFDSSMLHGRRLLAL